MGIFILLLFIGEVYFLVRSDKKRWGTLMTPFSLLALTFTGVTIIAILYSYLLKDVKDFYLPSLIVWAIGLVVFYLPSRFFAVKKIAKSDSIELRLAKKDDMYNWLFIIAMIGVSLGLLKVRSLGVQYDFGSDEFGEGFGSGGLLAHTSMLLTGLFAYFVCKLDKNHKLALIPMALILVIMFAQASKTRTLSPLLMGLFAAVFCGKMKVSVRTIVFMILAASSFFFLAYYFSLVATGIIDDPNEFWEFISMHFLNYFLGGTLSFSLDYKAGILEPDMTSGLVDPFLTVINKLFGWDSGAVIDNPKMLDMGLLGSTNVRTFFGTMYAYSKNYLVMINLSFFLSLFIHYIYYKTRATRNIFLVIASCSNLTYLMFGGFFDFYWIHIYPYEIVVIFIVLYFISKSTINVSAKEV